MAKLWKCERCSKTCSTWEISPVDNLCSVCYGKIEADRKRLDNFRSSKKPSRQPEVKKRVANKTVRDLEKIAPIFEE